MSVAFIEELMDGIEIKYSLLYIVIEHFINTSMATNSCILQTLFFRMSLKSYAFENQRNHSII